MWLFFWHPIILDHFPFSWHLWKNIYKGSFPISLDKDERCAIMCFSCFYYILRDLDIPSKHFPSMWVPTFALSSLDPFLYTHSEDIYPLFSSFGGQIGKIFLLATSGSAKNAPPNSEFFKKVIKWDFLKKLHQKVVLFTLFCMFTQAFGLIWLFEFLLEMLK